MVDTANTGMDKPTDSLRTEQTTDPLLTEKDTCAYLRVSKRNLYCWRMAGLIPYSRAAAPCGSKEQMWTRRWRG